MAATVPSKIFGLRGRCVKSVDRCQDTAGLMFRCERDERFKPSLSPDGRRCTVNRRLHKQIKDLSVFGRRVVFSISYC